MIILKILLYVLLAVVGLVVLLLVLALALPIVADVSYKDGKFRYKLKFWLICLDGSDGKGLIKSLKKRRRKKKIPEKDDDGESDDFYDDIEESDAELIDIEEIIPDDSDFEEMTEESDEDRIRTEKIRRIKEKKSQNNKKTDNGFEKEKESPSGELIRKIDFLLDIWDTADRPLLKVFKGIYIKNIFIDFIVADEDAYKCAVNYGRVCAVVYNALAWLGEACTVSYKTVDIQSGFSLEKSQWDASCRVKFRLHTLVVSALWFLAVYLFKIYIPDKKKKKRKKKNKNKKRKK